MGGQFQDTKALAALNCNVQLPNHVQAAVEFSKNGEPTWVALDE